MKKVFTLIIALLSIFATAKAADLVFNVTVPMDNSKPTTHMTYEVWVVGNFNGWNNNLHKMTKVDDTHYTITIPEAEIAAGVTAANCVYKYLSGGGDWAYVEKDAAGAEISDRVYADPVNDVVLSWALTFDPRVEPIPMRVTVEAFVPVDVIELYIVGTFNGWSIPTDSTKMKLEETTAEGKIFSVSFFSEDVQKLKYKFCAGPAWDYEQTAGDIQYPDKTQNTAYHQVSEFKKYYDPSKVGNINITAIVPAGTERVWIMGSHLGWNWANLKEGTKNTDGTFSFVAENVQSIEYRLYNWNTEWSHPEAKDDDPTVERPNRLAEYPADANITITVSAWRNAAPSAINMLDADKYKIYTNQNSIVVEGVTSKVELFDITGRNIESTLLNGTYKSKTLNSGLYIVKVDGATQKVSVR